MSLSLPSLLVAVRITNQNQAHLISLLSEYFLLEERFTGDVDFFLPSLDFREFVFVALSEDSSDHLLLRLLCGLSSLLNFRLFTSRFTAASIQFKMYFCSQFLRKVHIDPIKYKFNFTQNDTTIYLPYLTQIQINVRK